MACCGLCSKVSFTKAIEGSIIIGLIETISQFTVPASSIEGSDLTTAGSSPEELIGQLPSLARDIQLSRVLEWPRIQGPLVSPFGSVLLAPLLYIVSNNFEVAAAD